jgi:Flp pilus assembly pilin Flp
MKMRKLGIQKQYSGALTIEYLAIFVAILIAFLAMFSTIKQIVSGRFRETADLFGSGRQFDPIMSTVNVNIEE